MEPLAQAPQTHLPTRLLAAFLAALIAVLGLLYLGLWFFSNYPFTASSDEAARLELLSSLKADSEVPDEQKVKILNAIRTTPGAEAKVSEKDKEDILSSLRDQQ